MESTPSSALTVDALLVDTNARLQSRVNRLETQYSPHTVIETILGCIEEHYDLEMKKRADNGTTSLRLTDVFYAVETDGSHTAIDPSIAYSIESLWLGRIDKKRVIHNGQSKVLMLHPSQLNDDRPLPLFMDATGTAQGIVMRHAHRSHSFICKNDPAIPGLVFGSVKAKEWLAMPNFKTAQSTSIWPQHETLERIASMWLGRASRQPSVSTLIVDSQLIRKFVQTMALNENARCHFTCSGQSTLHAYLCLTAEDEEQTDLAKIPIGTIA